MGYLSITDEELVTSYFVVGNLAGTEAEVVRIAGLLRATESTVQAVSVSPFRLYQDVFVSLL